MQDKVKNLTGLAELYGSNNQLRELVNLVIVGGVIDPKATADREEAAECEKMHELIKKYDMDGSFRWIVAQKNRIRNGELYRYIADKKGAFVQPALYEAFGLTVVEAMTCGLPVFGTRNGGPAEVIKRGTGFLIDPWHSAEAAETMIQFFERCQEESGYWERISAAAEDRIASHYTWQHYASRLVSLCSVYSYWSHTTSLERREARRYLEAIYILLMRRLIKKVRKLERVKFLI